LEAVPETGRTHQVRAHAAALGFPLLGDTLYGASPTDLITRPALHAWSLAFTKPASGEQSTFNAPYPEDFRIALEKLRTVGRVSR
jgi:23S rRNA pseudouridine1911/1915/1917 synthase